MARHGFSEFRTLGRAAVAAAALLALSAPLPLRAETVPTEQSTPASTEARALFDVMRLSEVLSVMRAEGEEYGATLETDMFPGQGGAAWAAKVQSIYDLPRMEARFADAFVAAIGDNAAATAKSAEFFASDLGQRILTLEIEARRALLDDAAEDAAKIAWLQIESDEEGRAERLRAFAEANDLIESNVQGTLNANLAFFRGMAEGGAIGPEVAEDEMLSNVWAQEDSVRQQTAEWLFPYLALAYEPLSDADLDAYTAFSASAEGRALNGALFAAFGALFEDISFALGAAVAVQMQGQDI